MKIYVFLVFWRNHVRDFNKGGQGRSFGPRQMYKAVCAECAQECEVPFQPKEGRPVYCKNCYSKKKNG
jgi:CxxC-x17-CxxC domain-containing protein